MRADKPEPPSRIDATFPEPQRGAATNTTTSRVVIAVGRFPAQAKEHLQIKRRRQQRLPTCPRSHELQVLIDQALADADHRLTRRLDRTNNLQRHRHGRAPHSSSSAQTDRLEHARRSPTYQAIADGFVGAPERALCARNMVLPSWLSEAHTRLGDAIRSPMELEGEQQ
jgi:hypothetical protein